MRQCPKCRKWTLDFDDYFCRFRCLNPACAWMPPSTAEREIRSLQSYREPTKFESVPIPELGLTISPSYDRENDALLVDFGLNEQTFDLPEPDGMLIWRIGRRTDRVAGFTIFGFAEGAISRITIEFIVQRKGDIERGLRRFPQAFAKGRATRDLVEEVVVTALTEDGARPITRPETQGAWERVVGNVRSLIGS